jgi:hypothetical protein
MLKRQVGAAERQVLEMSSTSTNGGAILVAGKNVEYQSALPLNDIYDPQPLPFSAVLIAESESLEWDIARLKKLGADRIVPVNSRSATLKEDVEKAWASCLAGSAQKLPSARLLKLAKLTGSKMNPSLLGPAAPMIESMARLAGAPFEFVAGSVLASVSGLIAGRHDVHVRAGWTVNPILWLALVGDASSGKSPAMDLVLKPLRAMENEEARRYSAALESARGAGDKQAVKAAIAAVPKANRLIVNNATIEALQHTAAEQGRAMLAAYDELSEWFSSLMKYNRAATGDRGPWLSAHNGFPLTVDRRSLDAPLRIQHWGVAVLGAIPPSVLTALAKGAELESGDGLDVRLLYLRPALPDLAARPNPGDDKAEGEWAKAVRLLWSARTEATGVEPIPFDETARDKFEAWRFNLLEQARRGGREVSSWVGKLPGLVTRLCGVLAALDAAVSGEREPKVIDTAILKRAAALADIFTAHRRKVELERGAPPVEQLAAELAGFVVEHNIRALNTFEIRRGLIPGIRSEPILRSVLREFQSAGWTSGYLPVRNDEPLPATVTINSAVFDLGASP